MANSVEDLINQALRQGSLPFRIQDIYEGTNAAKVALELYGQARDELLDAKDWSFSRRTNSLTLLKGPPPSGGYTRLQPWNDLTSPAPGWLYEYAYPADCIDLRAIIEPPGSMPDLDPVPQVWRVDNDPTPFLVGDPPTGAVGPEAKVIFCNVTGALAVYRSRVIDPAIFDPGYSSALISLLGKRFAKAFGDSVEQQKQDMGEAQMAAQEHADVRG